MFMERDIYEPDYYDTKPMCSKCQEKEQTFDEASEFLDEIVKQLYQTGPFDKCHFEYCLESLCHYLKVKMSPEILQIERKRIRSEFLNDWVDFNQQYLKQIAQ